MQPKAKWTQDAGKEEWSAEVGPFGLMVAPKVGKAVIWSIADRGPVWSQTVPTPCDVTDLMRLAESELARRLNGAAETMEGSELVATPVIHKNIVVPVLGDLSQPRPTPLTPSDIRDQTLIHGSRDWAIAQMKAGKTVVDVYDRKWRYDVLSQFYSRNRDLGDGTAVVADYPEIPPALTDGWSLA